MARFLSVFSFFTLLLCGCQKRVDTFVPDGAQSGPDTTWQNTLTADMPVVSLKNDLQLTPVVDSFFYNNTGIVYDNNSLAVTVPANGLITASGIIPSGNIVRRSLLLQKNGDLIAESIATASNGSVLVCAGAFFMTLTSKRDFLQTAPGTALSVKYNSDNSNLPALKVFNAAPDFIHGFGWQQNADTALNKVIGIPGGYRVLTGSLSWVLPAYVPDTTGIAETSLIVQLPSNYTNANTEVYVSFNDLTAVADLHGDAISKTFVSGPLPINKTVTVVVLSKQAGDYYLAVEQTATVSGAVQPQVIIPVKSTLADIKTALATL